MEENKVNQSTIPPQNMADSIAVGDTVEAEVFKITSFGAFVRLPNQKKGLIHISQVADSFVKDINHHLKVGDKVNARVITISDNKIDLTLKKERPGDNHQLKPKGFRSSDFEDKLKHFLKKSNERQSDLRKNTESKIGSGKAKH